MATKKETTKKEEVIVPVLVPRITEKSGILSGKNAYTFLVADTMNKREIVKEFKKVYKKDAIKVTIGRLPKKPIVRFGRQALKPGYKKAIVTLKKGDKIEFI